MKYALLRKIVVVDGTLNNDNSRVIWTRYNVDSSNGVLTNECALMPHITDDSNG